MKNIWYVVLVFCLFTALSKVTFGFPPSDEESWEYYYKVTNDYLDSNKYDSALVIANITLQKAEEEFGKKDSNYSKSLYILFETYYRLRQFDKALEFARLDSSLVIDLYTVNSRQYIAILVAIAETYSDASSFDNAEVLFKSALSKSREIFHAPDSALADAINRTGVFYNSMAKFKEAGALFDEALAMYRELFKGDHALIATLMNNVGFNYYCIGNTAEAEKYYKESLEMTKRVYPEGHADLAVRYNNIGLFYSRQFRNKEAEENYLEAIKIRRKLLGDAHPHTLQSMNNLAAFYSAMGKFQQAEKIFNEIIDIINKSFKDDNPELAIALNDLALLYTNTGRYQQAEPLFKESLEMKKRIFKGDHPTVANGMTSLGYYYTGMGRHVEALALYDSALAMFRRVHNNRDNDDVIKTLNNLGTAQMSLNKFDAAEATLKEAVDMAKRFFKGSHLYVAGTLNNYCGCLTKRGKYDEAIPYLKESLDMVKDLYKSDHYFVATYLNNLGLAYMETKKLAEAEPYLVESNEMISRLYNKYNPLRLKILANLGGFYFGWNKRDSAEKYYLEAMDIAVNVIKYNFPFLSENEKKQFYNSFTEAINNFYRFCLERYKENPAIVENVYNIRLATKAILLNNSIKIRERIFNSGDSSLINLYNTWKAKKEALAGYNKQLVSDLIKRGIDVKAVENEANDIEKELSVKSELLSSDLNKGDVKWTDIKKTLGKDESVVELIRLYFTNLPGATYRSKDFDSLVYIGLILKNNSKIPEMVVLNNGKEIENEISTSYSSLIDKQRRKTIHPVETADELGKIYNICWKNIQPFIKNQNTIYISPDGAYNKINLNTLYNSNAKKYILEDYDIRQITTPVDLIKSGNSGKTYSKYSELFGDPKFNLDSSDFEKIENLARKGSTRGLVDASNLDSLTRDGISPLPGTRSEIENISRELSKYNWTVNKHLGTDALEDLVKSVNKPGVLHIATHGLFMGDNKNNSKSRSYYEPLLRSFLLFAGAENYLNNPKNNSEGDDGILTAYEAMNLNLDNTELVVLSACETGLGDIQSGEGVYGLQRAFKVAGAKNLIMSLWSVSDEATQELMSLFYEKWLSGKNKRDAFRQAQLELKKKYPEPYFWGAFVMVGE
ncbi:MAG: CHAT domain-containing protein [Ignavibacteriae bacterium]|nr:CHAT domain-containing protein [Ignavibacteriota bacterium]